MATADKLVERMLELHRDKVEDLHERLLKAIAQMDDESLCWRPHPYANNAVSLVTHMSGNLRQRFVAGIGGAEDTRQREEEFEGQRVISREAILDEIKESFGWVKTYLQNVTADQLSDTFQIQGLSMTVQDVIFGVVTHLSEHVGQIIYIGKLRGLGQFAPLWKPRGRTLP